MKILGLGHYSRTGKDSLANMIIEQNVSNGMPIIIKKISLAWKLKQICFDLYGWAGLQPPEYYDTKEGEPYRDITIRALGKTPVEIWVAFGTPAVREQVYDRTWIDYVLQVDHACDLLIVPDVRFPNEVEAFRDEGAMLVKTIREGYGPRNTVADMALVGWNNWDFLSGPTMEHLEFQAESFLLWANNSIEFPNQTEEDRQRMFDLEGSWV